LHTKCRTGLCQTGWLRTRPWGTKPRRALQNHHGRHGLFWYYAVYSDNSLPTFRDNLSVPSSRVKKSHRDITAKLKLTDTILFFGTLSIVKFFKKQMFQNPAVFPFLGKGAPNLEDL